MSDTEERILMPKALTAENGAKYLLLGDFSQTIDVSCLDCINGMAGGDMDQECETCGGSGSLEQDVVIDWTTIKEIYAKAVKYLGKPNE